MFDLLFVGAGASTSYVVLSLLGSLDGPPRDRPVRIAVVERAPDPFTGVPYGSRAAPTALLITPLRDFLPEPERGLFVRWLSENKGWVFDEFRAAGGPFSTRWWERHRAAVERDDFDDLYLPRYTFGEYLGRRTRAAIDEAAARGLATTEVLRDDVVAVEKAAHGYRVRCAGRVVDTSHAVLAVGSAPVRSRLRRDTGLPGPLLVDDPFDDMGEAVTRIAAAVRGVRDRPAHVVVLGANAGTMDMLFQINDRLGADDATFTVVSPSGQLPERLDEQHEPRPFRAERLEALERAGTAAAISVYEAALADIARGRAAGLSVADTLGPISQAVGRVLPLLAEDQTVEFADRWGVALGRHQRRAGWEYCEVVEHLAAGGRLQLVAGSFVDLVDGPDGRTRVRYGADGGEHVADPPADVVVNCAGPSGSLRLAAPPLLERLVADGVCRLTPSGGGVHVGPDLAAAPGFYVMGPLLAGNVVAGRPVWHMEHCGRISAFGATLGAELAGALEPVGA